MRLIDLLFVSLKVRGEKGRHASLTSPDGKPQSAVIEEDHNDEGDTVAFHLEQATSSYLVVKAFEGPLRFKVIRPYAVFQNIHAKGVKILGCLHTICTKPIRLSRHVLPPTRNDRPFLDNFVGYRLSCVPILFR